MSYAHVSRYSTGEDDALYGVWISQTTGKIWNGSSMVTIADGARAVYAIDATALGNGWYGHEVPSGLPSGDTYTLYTFVPESSSDEPADSDTPVDPPYTFTKTAATADDDDEPETIEEAIEMNAKGPKQVTGDSGSVTQHSLQDQIAADRYTGAKAAAGAGGLGLKFVKLIPPGQE